jgi:hypothetical protein
VNSLIQCLRVLGLQRSGEAYAPDESDAIAQLAHDAGAALDVLAIESERTASGGEALEELARMTLQSVRELCAANRAVLQRFDGVP